MENINREIGEGVYQKIFNIVTEELYCSIDKDLEDTVDTLLDGELLSLGVDILFLLKMKMYVRKGRL